ncbi:Nitroreductase [Tilletiaria anomala UBC 951]|uniref:Nitroreductase n=1 Tax=Tilletiaria anomala (strain ATCC 24038 / CBS 436.72 / UBC 951) TaxID=1037660 RepID=A0A066WHZ2_TILAU|nr:Nitroreductase [Tilletiaria anomala UBC 951]KDN53416.1 Nitroreductase [Tilletiaria anomala UBC 951]
MATSQAFLDGVKARRSIHQNTDKEILGQDELITPVSDTIKYSPSAFNSQSSRAIILLGKAHKNYWNEFVPQNLGENQLKAVQKRLPWFAAAQGTVIFFEDKKVIDEYRGGASAFSHLWDDWSNQASGMAQINLWTALEAEGYGVNLQHVAPMAGEGFKPMFNAALKVPSGWIVQAELVFGYPDQKDLKVKTFIEDSERFRVDGA